jgi:hypothetical protein
MGKAWSDSAILKLSDWATCPRCDSNELVDGLCHNCGADLRGAEAVKLADASRAAVTALTNREAALTAIPTSPIPQAATLPPAYAAAAASAAAPSAVPAPSMPAQPIRATQERATSQLSVQSVLAVVGAGLFAVAAIVFTFLSNNLTSFSSRTIAIGIFSLLFLGAAWLLARVKLQFSAETVGALGMVFVILDIWAFATGVDSTINDWALAAIATLVASLAMVGLATIRRMRTWLWAGLVGVTITPALLSYADGREISLVLGSTGVVGIGLVAHALIRGLQTRFASPLRTDTVTVVALQILAAITTIGYVFAFLEQLGEQRYVIASITFCALALLGLLSARFAIAAVWSGFAGVMAATSAAMLGIALVPSTDDGSGNVVALGIASATALIAITAVSIPRSGVPSPTIRRTVLLWSAWTTTLLFSVPAIFLAIFVIAAASFRSEPDALMANGLLGVSVLSVALIITGQLSRTLQSSGARPLSVVSTVTGIWVAGLALVTGMSWSLLEPVTQVVVGLVLAAAIAGLVIAVPRVRALPLRYRIPLIGTAHALLIQAAVLSWNSDLLILVGGAAVVVVGALLAYTVAAEARWVHVVVVYAYALVLFTYGLSLTALDDPTVFNLTATAALLFAAGITLVRHFAAPFWIAILSVTAIPFLVAILSIFDDRIIGNVFSMAAAAALSITLVLARRGSTAIATIGAGLIVPTLAVFIIALTAVVAQSSGSPIALPIVAGLIAVVLPLTATIRRALNARDYAWSHHVQLAIESTSLLTGLLAVVVAIVRDAAGFGTSFLVLAIVGIGAAATAQFARRRYGWIVAYISLTGALWSMLALHNVDVIESYVLPPAIVAAIIGAFTTIRGLRGRWFYVAGLGSTVIFALAFLTVLGYGSTSIVPWRAIGLTAGAVLLIVIGMVFTRFAKSRPLAQTTFIAAIVAAAAPTVQGVRYGLDADPVPTFTDEGTMGVALALGGLAAALAIVAAALLTSYAGRWRYAPAIAYLAASPIFAIEHNEFAATVLYALMVVFLVVILVTAWIAARASVSLPPIWFTFGFAWITAVVAWNEHYLRVDPYSIPMGLTLLIAGVIVMRRGTAPTVSPTINSWPVGFRGSWGLLAPGITLTVLASIIATATTPETWRAILVIAFALAAVFVGLRANLASPFIVGIGALILEIIVVFLAQLGTSIDPMWWWITLATAGVMVLVVAVNLERRTAGGGVAARLRDLK